MVPSPTPPRFSASISTSADVAVVAFEGEIDLETADEFEAALTAVRGHGQPTVVDLHACPFMDSTGLQRLLRHREETLAQGRRTVVVYEAGGTIARLVSLVAPGVFETAETVDDARALVATAAAS